MDPLISFAQIAAGDVLLHPKKGLVRVFEVDSDSSTAELRRGRESVELPGRVGVDELMAGWTRCPPGGFFARVLEDHQGLRRLAEREPAVVLTLLADAEGGSVPRARAQDLLLAHDLVGPDRIDAWWQSALSLARSLPRLQVVKERVSLRPPPTLVVGAEGWETLFLQLTPVERARQLDSIPEDRWGDLLGVAVAHREAGTIHLLLRRGAPIPQRAVYGLVDLALSGDLAVMAALLGRREPAAEGALTRMAAAPERRPMLIDAIQRLEPESRHRAVMGLLERCLGDAAGPGVARFLSGLLPGTLPASPPAEGPGGPTPFPLASAWLQSMDGTTTVELSIADEGPLLVELGRIAPSEVLPLGLALAQALASRHAVGATGGLPGARRNESGEVVLGPLEETSAAEDVRMAMRLLLRQSVGTLPRRRAVADEALLAHLPALVPDLDPEVAAVLTRALATQAHARPANAIELWEQLAHAQAIASVRAQAPAQRRTVLQIAHDTHIGQVKSRIGQTNQDALYYSSDGDLSLLVVADGISVASAGSGNLASALLVQVMANLWDQRALDLSRASGPALHEFLDSALAGANRTICEAAIRLAGGDLGRHIPMGSTVVAAVVQGSVAHIASQGDSRAYLISRCGAAQLTPDHNLRGEWLLAWQRGEAMEMLNEGYALTGYVGHFDEHGTPMAAPVFHRTVRMLPGETLILLTDGVTDYAADDPGEMAVLLEAAGREPELTHACRALTDRSNAGGGGDNVTVLMARLMGG